MTACKAKANMVKDFLHAMVVPEGDANAHTTAKSTHSWNAKAENVFSCFYPGGKGVDRLAEGAKS